MSLSSPIGLGDALAFLAIAAAGFLLVFGAASISTVGIGGLREISKLKHACELNLPRTKECVLAFVPEDAAHD